MKNALTSDLNYDTMQETLFQIAKKLSNWISYKKTGKLIFEINLRNGGIGISNIRTDEKLK